MDLAGMSTTSLTMNFNILWHMLMENVSRPDDRTGAYQLIVLNHAGIQTFFVSHNYKST